MYDGNGMGTEGGVSGSERGAGPAGINIPGLDGKVANAPTAQVQESAEAKYNTLQQIKRKLSFRTSGNGDTGQALEDLDREEQELAASLKSGNPLVQKLYRLLADYNLMEFDTEKEAGKVVESCNGIITELEGIVTEANTELYGRNYSPGRPCREGLYAHKNELAGQLMDLKDGVKAAKEAISSYEIAFSEFPNRFKQASPDLIQKLRDEMLATRFRKDESKRDQGRFEAEFIQADYQLKNVGKTIEETEMAVKIATDLVNDARIIVAHSPERSRNREYFRAIPSFAEKLRSSLGNYVEFMEKMHAVQLKQDDIIARQVEEIPELSKKLPSRGIDEQSPLANIQRRHERLSDEVAQRIEEMESDPLKIFLS